MNGPNSNAPSGLSGTQKTQVDPSLSSGTSSAAQSNNSPALTPGTPVGGISRMAQAQAAVAILRTASYKGGATIRTSQGVSTTLPAITQQPIAKAQSPQIISNSGEPAKSTQPPTTPTVIRLSSTGPGSTKPVTSQLISASSQASKTPLAQTPTAPAPAPAPSKGEQSTTAAVTSISTPSKVVQTPASAISTKNTGTVNLNMSRPLQQTKILTSQGVSPTLSVITQQPTTKASAPQVISKSGEPAKSSQPPSTPSAIAPRLSSLGSTKPVTSQLISTSGVTSKIALAHTPATPPELSKVEQSTTAAVASTSTPSKVVQMPTSAIISKNTGIPVTGGIVSTASKVPQTQPQVSDSQVPTPRTSVGSKIVPGTSGLGIRTSLKSQPPFVRQSAPVAPPKTSSPQSGKLKRVVMRLRCKFRSLQDAYLKDGRISDQDTDVVFCCKDGGRVKGHKVILSSVSTYFTDIFIDQKAGKMTTVFVPDVRSDTMKIILTLAYKDNVVVNINQIEEVKEYCGLFGLNWDFLRPEVDKIGMRLDVKPGKILESPPKPPPPLMAKPTHQLPSAGYPQRRMVSTIGAPRFQAPPGNLQSPAKMAGQRRGIAYFPGGRSNMPSEAPRLRHAYDPEGEGYSDASEDSNTEFQLQSYNGLDPNQERRKSKLTPRVETETDEMDENDLTSDPVAAQRMIKTWLSQIGKADINDGPQPKRPRLDPGRRGVHISNYECTVCNAKFVKENAWRWHEERHVGLGLFKCLRCERLEKSAVAIWNHEKEVHRYTPIAEAELEERRPIPSNFQVVENRRHPTGKVVNKPGLFQRGSASAQLNQRMQLPVAGGARNIAAMKIAHLKRLKAPNTGGRRILENRTHSSVGQRSSPGVGQTAGPEQVDTKKLKQLHWHYVCAKCDNCSDSNFKAVNHFRKCYKDQVAQFENTVTKYKQGFYGKSMCPLCPRRYAANGGFMIHCGHVHQDYRRLFSHTGAAEDKLKCVNCQRKFALPSEFHDHLENGLECTKNPINEESMPLLSSSRSGSGTPAERNKRRTLVSARSPVTAEDTPPPVAVPIRVPPRSARLAQRLSVARRALAEGEESKTIASTRLGSRRGSGLDYPPADCPICGASEVSNISQHITLDHEELNVSVHRISTELLRCKKCLITFAICDLLAHTNTCTPTEEPQSAEDGQSTPDPSNVLRRKRGNPGPKARREPPVLLTKEQLPPGVGDSPVDKIECTDLYSRETLRKGLTCGVCGKTAMKLGDISICLRTHGVHRCPLCFNSYSEKEDYSLHMRKCHASSNASNKLKCPLCNRAFINAGQVTGHMYSQHWVSLLNEMKQELRKNGHFLQNDDVTEQQASSSSNEGAKAENETTEIGGETEEENGEQQMEADDEQIGDDYAEEADDSLNRVDDVSTIVNEKEETDEARDLDVPAGIAEPETTGKLNDTDTENHDLYDENKTGDQ